MFHTDGMFRQYGAIEKTEDRPEGLYVRGIASTEAEDSQGERVTAKAMRRALRGYFTKSATGELTGPIREMHQLSAVGKCISAEVDGQGRTHVEAIIVDGPAAAKVRAGVYKGFSIGGRVPVNGRNKDDPRIIEDLTLSELSLVDRPANSEAVIEMVKADQIAKQRDDAIHRLAITRDDLLKASRERDGALRKLTATQGDLRKVQGERDAARAEVRALEGELRRRPKGALKAVAVTKAADVVGLTEAPEEPEDTFSLIKAAHKSPQSVRFKID